MTAFRAALALTFVCLAVPLPAVALPSLGGVAAWGHNASGELCDGTVAGKPAPVAINGLTEVAAVAGGNPYGPGAAIHSVALKKDGTVWAWGKNTVGQLGDGCTIGV